jgi:hypothetical protein
MLLTKLFNGDGFAWPPAPEAEIVHGVNQPTAAAISPCAQHGTGGGAGPAAVGSPGGWVDQRALLP